MTILKNIKKLLPFSKELDQHRWLQEIGSLPRRRKLRGVQEELRTSGLCWPQGAILQSLQGGSRMIRGAPCLLSHSVVSNSSWPHGLQPMPGSPVHGISTQECWSGLPCLPPGDLPDPGIKPVSLLPPALAGGFFTTTATWKAQEEPKKVYLCGLFIYLDQRYPLSRKAHSRCTKWTRMT